MTKELREMSYDQLVEYSAQVFKEVRRRAYGEGYRQGKFDAEVTNEQTKETSQQARDRIVEQAKADIEGLINEYQLSSEEIEFVVDKEKSTVIAKIKHIFSGKILAKGIAKCTPDGCFNVHIGKAISLRRALGLEVPTEYLNAPQPTEVRVGDVVDYEGYRVTVRPAGRLYRYDEGFCAIGSYVAETGKIIDDSREV